MLFELTNLQHRLLGTAVCCMNWGLEVDRDFRAHRFIWNFTGWH